MFRSANPDVNTDHLAKSTVFIGGFSVVETLIRAAPQQIVQVFVDKARVDDRANRLKAALTRAGLSWQPVSAEKIDALASSEHHQGVVVEVLDVSILNEKALIEHIADRPEPFLCVLEGIQDPRNLGACLRTAEAAGVDAVVLSKRDCSGLTPVARHVSAGAAELVTVAAVPNLVRALTRLQQELGVWVIGTDSEASETLYDVTLRGATALVFGSEGKGLKRLTLDSCDHVAKVPMCGAVGSLNVSVAVGIGLFEALRQRSLR